MKHWTKCEEYVKTHIPHVPKNERPIVVHTATRSTISIAAVITLVAHYTYPELEAALFCFTGIFSVWAGDIERCIRHPHFKVPKDN